MKKLGITTTVPIEVLIAAGYQPVDLNNLLVSDPRPERLVNIAERAGFPLNCCAWIKGIYGACLDYSIDNILCVTTGDCSNTLMLMEVLKLKKPGVMGFAYPPAPDAAAMQRALEALARSLGTTIEAAARVGAELKTCRQLALKLDELTWKENVLSGCENHLWLVSASDFNGDPRRYTAEARALIGRCLSRQPYAADQLRLAYIGVPPVYARDLYRYIERHGARVVFNEVQRQFAMPAGGPSLAEQYTTYTYPYSIQGRLDDIKKEVSRRRIDGVIHYVQAFCHRGIGDIIFREALGLPVLTMEGNDDFFLSSHVKTRLEAFIDMLERGRRVRQRTAGTPVVHHEDRRF
jgi:benzoyl-CoA reductase/2-hydroxyglutaryl-CoA dehydratase subunit BcrC/BadD/HgdB